MKHIVKILFLLIVASVFIGCGNGGNSTVTNNVNDSIKRNSVYYWSVNNNIKVYQKII